MMNKKRETNGVQKTRTRHLFWLNAVSVLAFCILLIWVVWGCIPSDPNWNKSMWIIWIGIFIFLSILAVGTRMFTFVHNVTVPKVRKSYIHEWQYNHEDQSSPPKFGIAMSGGGIRSAAFNLGVLNALHENRLLQSIDVMSAVSGGTYIMSWYLLQPFYAALSHSPQNGRFNLTEVIDEMFKPDGRFQSYLRHNPETIELMETGIQAVLSLTIGQPLRALTLIGNNVDSYNSVGTIRWVYRQGIQKLFHGHPQKDSPNKIDNSIKFKMRLEGNVSDFSCVTPVTFLELAKFVKDNHLPFFIFNCAALVDRSFRHMLWPTVFELTADDLGSDLCGYCRWDELAERDSKELIRLQGRRRRSLSWLHRLEGAPIVPGSWVHMVNVVPAISGAAVGLSRFDKKKTTRSMKLATWSPFIGNLDLGYLIPRKILNTNKALYVSDGGHAENLGAYSLIRRKCRTIVIVDAEHERGYPFVFDGYSKLKRQLQLENEQSLCLKVDEIDSYLKTTPNGPPPSVTTGTITPMSGSDANEQTLSVVYIKLVLDGSHINLFPPEVRAYAEKNKSFPQDPTTDQTYTPEQFTAYTLLGKHIGGEAVENIRNLLL